MSFEQKYNAAESEQKIREFWQENKIYEFDEKTSKPTLGDIGLYYQTEIGSTIYSSFVQGLDFTDKFVKDIDRYNYNFSNRFLWKKTKINTYLH